MPILWNNTPINVRALSWSEPEPQGGGRRTAPTGYQTTVRIEAAHSIPKAGGETGRLTLRRADVADLHFSAFATREGNIYVFDVPTGESGKPTHLDLVETLAAMCKEDAIRQA